MLVDSVKFIKFNMNWNINKNENNPWGSGNSNSPWGSNDSGSNRGDFEDQLKRREIDLADLNSVVRNLSIFILVAILLWLATGFYRVEPDEQGIELLLEDGMVKLLNQDSTIFFLHLLVKQLHLRLR